MCLSHGLTGKPFEKEHFHVPLFHVGNAVCDPPTKLVEILTERAAKVVMPSFRVAFDRAMSFRNGALVLAGDDSVIGVEVLQQRLSDALDGRPRPARPFTPHLTLLRDSQRVATDQLDSAGDRAGAQPAGTDDAPTSRAIAAGDGLGPMPD